MNTQAKPSFQPSSDLIRAAENLMACMTLEQLVRPVVETYKTAILARHQFKPAPMYREHFSEDMIVDPKCAFLLSPEDAAVYYAECNSAREAAGLKVSAPQNCPLLEAENLRTAAESSFIAKLGSLPGLELLAEQSTMLTLELRKQLVDTGLRLVAPYVGNADSILQRMIKA